MTISRSSKRDVFIVPNTVDHLGNKPSAYRAYMIGNDGRIEKSTPIDAVDDAGAIEQARQLIDGHAVELWDRGRRIVTIETDRSATKRGHPADPHAIFLPGFPGSVDVTSPSSTIPSQPAPPLCDPP